MRNSITSVPYLRNKRGSKNVAKKSPSDEGFFSTLDGWNNHSYVRAYCEQVPKRDWNNLWQFNTICTTCFHPQATIIGTCYVVILTSPNPLHELFRYTGLDDWVVVIDFDEQFHADLGGCFDLFLLTTNTLECKEYQAFYPDSPKKVTVYM